MRKRDQILRNRAIAAFYVVGHAVSAARFECNTLAEDDDELHLALRELEKALIRIDKRLREEGE